MQALVSAPKQRSQYSGRARMDVHMGQALLIIAGTYPSLFESVLEIIQNDLDEGASRISVNVNYKKRDVVVRDNGRGTSIKRFNEALATICTPGRKKPGSLGRFGIGLISPLGKCQQFRFTSCEPGKDQWFNEWLFIARDIIGSREAPEPPHVPRNDLTLLDGIPNKTKVWWRSEMCLSGITDDKVINDIQADNLIAAIQDRYGPTMRRNKTVISLDILYKSGHRVNHPNITAPDFNGQPLPEASFTHGASGKTTFRLFVAKKTHGSRKGKVLMGVAGDEFRIEFRHFATAVTSIGHLGSETLSALRSGLFEGEIICEKVKLHPNRKAFVNDMALLDLCIAIEEWMEKYGSKYMEDIKEDQQAERLQDLGLRSMRVLEQMLRDPSMEHLLSVIKSFKLGHIGIGHTVPPKSKVVGVTGPGLSLDGQPGIPRSPSDEPREVSPKPPKDEHPKHTPLVVDGPRGPIRKVVKSSSLGLEFVHDAMEGSRDLWRLDKERGILIFNIRHPLWMMCDVRDSTLMKLQECVAIEALTLESMPEDSRPAQRQILDHLNNVLAPWILHGDKIRSEGKG